MILRTILLSMAILPHFPLYILIQACILLLFRLNMIHALITTRVLRHERQLPDRIVEGIPEQSLRPN